MSEVPPNLSPTNAVNAAGAAMAQYDLAFQISPIILQNGIASGAQGKILPIIQLYGQSIPIGSSRDAYPRFLPAPGSTLISQSIGMYPFANQAVAGNAPIQQPKTCSLIMIAPVNQPGGYLSKMSLFGNLQQSLEQHNASGGTYIIVTPAFVFPPMVMLTMQDVTDSEEKQKQVQWQIDFIAPILSQQEAAQAQNNMMSKISGGQPFTGPPTWSGNSGANPANLPGISAALAAFGYTLGTAQ